MNGQQTVLACRECSRRLGWTMALLSIWGLAAMVPILAQFSFDHPLIRWCRVTHQLTGPVGQTLTWASAILFLAGAGRTFRAFVSGLIRSRRLAAAFSMLRSAAPPQVQQAAASAGVSNLWFVAHPQPVMLTMGLLRPRVVLSDAAIQGLTAPELSAALLHEAAHCVKRDPLRQLLWASLMHGFGFIPGLRSAATASRSCSELHADMFAANRMGDTRALRGAMLKAARRAFRATPGTAGFSDELVLRARHLAGQDVSESIRSGSASPAGRWRMAWAYLPPVVSLLLPACFR